MKVLLILSGNISKAPYLSLYTHILDEKGIEYHIVSWNRLGFENEPFYTFNVRENETKGYVKRLLNYLKYRRHVLLLIKQFNYDRVIVFTIAIGLLIYPNLKRNFKKNYILDIRDYSILVKVTAFVFNGLIKNSFATVISSIGYKEWLPNNFNYYISHNIPFELIQKSNFNILENQFISNYDKRLRNITTIGTLRDYESNKMMIDSFKNCGNFKLNFIGLGPSYLQLKNYSHINNIFNIYFYGFYNKEEEQILLKDTDFLNVFTEFDINSKTLITNRFYLSVVLGIPMIVRSGTYQAFLCNQYSLGCVIDPCYSIKQQLLDYINKFNINIFNTGRTEFWKVVRMDLKKIEELLDEFLT